MTNPSHPTPSSCNPTPEEMMAGYAVACRFKVYESQAFALTEHMWRAFRAASAVSPSQAQSGWKLVPIEPTEEMAYRGGEATAGRIEWDDAPDDAPDQLARAIYRSMLKAAPAAGIQSPAAPAKITSLAEFCAEGQRLGITAFDLAEALSKRPEFADCLPAAAPVGGEDQQLSDERIAELWYGGREPGHDVAPGYAVTFARAVLAASSVLEAQPQPPKRCKGCDLPNGCPEFCWCDSQGAGKAEYASWFQFPHQTPAAQPQKAQEQIRKELLSGQWNWSEVAEKTVPAQPQPSDQGENRG